MYDLLYSTVLRPQCCSNILQRLQHWLLLCNNCTHLAHVVLGVVIHFLYVNELDVVTHQGNTNMACKQTSTLMSVTIDSPVVCHLCFLATYSFFFQWVYFIFHSHSLLHNSPDPVSPGICSVAPAVHSVWPYPSITCQKTSCGILNNNIYTIQWTCCACYKQCEASR